MADGTIEIDTKIISDGADTGLKKLGSVVKTGLTAAAAAAAALTAGVLAAGKAAVDVGSSFEAGMSEVAAISGAAGSDFEKLEKKAKEMGASTKFSATQSAEALKYMAMAGWDTSAMLSGLDGVMNLAAASGEDLGRVSDIVTDSMTAFGLSADESAHFADVLARAASTSNTNVGMMGDTFRYVAPVAGALGYNIEDVSVAVGLMANAGIKGEQAGTILRATLSRMAKPTRDTAAAMSDLGISLTNADGSMLSFHEIMLDLRDGFRGLTEEQKASYAAMLGGQEAMSGLLAIVNASEDDFLKLTASIGSADGAAKSMADTMQENLRGKITVLKSSLEGLGIQVYESLETPLKKATDTVTKSVNKITASMAGGKLRSAMDKIGKSLEKLAKNIAKTAERVIPKLVDAFAWLVDNGDKLIGSLKAAVAAFLTFKVVTTVSKWVKGLTAAYDVLKTHMEMQRLTLVALNGGLSASQLLVGVLTGKISVATAAQGAWNAVMNKNPILLLAGVIAVVIGAIVGYNAIAGSAEEKTYEWKESTDDLIDANDNLIDSLHGTQSAWADRQASITGEVDAAKDLADELEILASKEHKSAGEKRQLANAVEQLNNLMPELNLQYDEEADLLNKSTEEIRKYIDAKDDALRAEAWGERRLEIIKEQAEIESQQAENQRQLNDLTAKQNDLLEKRRSIEADMAEVTGAGGSIGYKMDELVKVNNELTALQTNMQAIEDKNTELSTAMAQSDESLAYAKEQMAQANQVAAQSEQELTDAMHQGSEQRKELTEEEKERLQDMQDAYDAYAQKAQDAFGKINESAELSVADMTKNLEANAATVEQWTANLSALADRNILSGGFMDILRQAGPESAKTVANLVSASDEELRQLETAFEKGGKAATQAMMDEFTSEQTLSIAPDAVTESAKRVDNNSELVNAAIRQVQAARNAAQNEVSSCNFSSIGLDISRGIAQGVTSGTSQVTGAMRTLIDNAYEAGRKAADSHSPSRRFAVLGRQDAQGVGVGFVKSVPGVFRRMKNALESEQSKLINIFSTMSEKLHTPVMGASPGGVTFNVSIHVDRMESDADIERIATSVSRRIGRKISAESRLKGVF